MRRFIAAALAILLILLVPVGVYAAEEQSEVFAYKESYNDSKNGKLTGNNIVLTYSLGIENGWDIWNRWSRSVTVKAKPDSGITITHIDAVVGWNPKFYQYLTVDYGEKEELDQLAVGDTFRINNINSDTVTFGSEYRFIIKKITVYYEETGSTYGSTFSGGNLGIIIGVALILFSAGCVFIALRSKKSES